MSGEGGRNRRSKYKKTTNGKRIEVVLSLFFSECCSKPWGSGHTTNYIPGGNKRVKTFSFSSLTVHPLDFSIKYKLRF
jgi:hypothetical protein